MKFAPLALSIFALFALTSSTVADIQPVSFDRFISGRGYALDGGVEDLDSGSVHSANPGLFAEAEAYHAELPNALGDGSAIQNSDVMPGSIQASGSASATGESYDFDAFAQGRGTSHFDLVFTLTDSSNYEITGELEAFDNGNSYVHLTRGLDVIHNFYASNNEIIPFSATGTLPPGEYRLKSDADASAWADGGFPFDYGYASYGLVFNLLQSTGIPAGERGDALFLSIAPNPVRSDAVIYHRIPRGMRASLEVFDVAGRLVRTLPIEGSGSGSVHWDGRDGGGREVAPGVYFVRLEEGDRSIRKKVLLVR